MAREVERATNGCCSPSEGTIYPVLREFEAGGYVTFESQLVSGRERKVYADHLEDCNTLSGVTTALDNQFQRGPGLIITPSLINLNLPLPGGYRLIGLADIAYGTSDGLAVNWETTDVYLRKRKKVPGQRGRPSERQAVRDIWEIARQSSLWPQHRLDQANFILAQWNRAEAPPSAGTIRNYIPKFEREAT